MLNSEYVGKEVLILVGPYAGVWGVVRNLFTFDTIECYIIALWNNPELWFFYDEGDFRPLGKDEVI